MPQYLSTAKMEAASARFASCVYTENGLEVNDTLCFTQLPYF